MGLDHGRITFPPPSMHLEATPEVIRGWYERQLEVDGYKQFLDGFVMNISNGDDGMVTKIHSKPFIFGTIDDHDYGQNNGDITFQYMKESNLAFMDFIYGGIDEDKDSRCSTEEKEGSSSHQRKGRSKFNDPMYQRSLDGKGVYGVQVFDFSRQVNIGDGNNVWGGGHWVPEYEAMIDPDVVIVKNETTVNYSTTHSVAVFALDVRSNKTPWPKGKHHGNNPTAYSSSSSSIDVPALDFLGVEQWEWLKSALANSHATVNVIVSGLQVHTDRFPNDGNVVEEWSKFPESRDMLYDMILNSHVKSPLLISGDVHMSQFLRKDCVRSMDVQKLNNDETKSQPPKRSLIEVTTSGMTHSWGTSFSSQPKHHTWPLWPYSYLVSRTFMTLCHFVCPWNEIITRNMGQEGDLAAGKQYYLGLNFAELEFDFANEEDNSDSGAVRVRIFGKKENEPPKLEARWTFEQLSGATNLPGMTAKVQDFVSLGKETSDWVCVPYRGLPSALHYYTAIVIQFVVFCFLFFLPYIVVAGTFVMVRRQWLSKRTSKIIDRSGESNRHTKPAESKNKDD